MKNRLQKLISHEGLTSAKLAEIAGVQPSAVSHILSGRNYPSFDFLANLLRAYPTISARWLLLGEGDIHGEGNKLNDISIAETMNSEPPKTDIKIEDIPHKLDNNASPMRSQKRNTIDVLSMPAPQNPKKEIDQIVIFYTDGTFVVYKNM